MYVSRVPTKKEHMKGQRDEISKDKSRTPCSNATNAKQRERKLK